jgi:transposase InsO family protein
VSVYPFVEAEKVEGGNVTAACSLMEVSRSAFYDWAAHRPKGRRLADQALSERIRAVFDASRGTYGWPRVHQVLRREGVCVSRKRVARLMRTAGLVGRCQAKKTCTTIPDPDAKAVDLLKRAFAPGSVGIDRVYVGDITYIWTWEGWLYLATVIDLASRRVVGWAMADHMRAELVCDALSMAVAARRPAPGLLFHSDRGTQGGFKWPSQHLDDGGSARCLGRIVRNRSGCIGGRSRRLAGRRWRGGRTGCASGRRFPAV